VAPWGGREGGEHLERALRVRGDGREALELEERFAAAPVVARVVGRQRL
jgi:hypothetical protein